MTLLETAKATVAGRKSPVITEEKIELALAWAKDEINYAQVLKALFGNKSGTMQAYVDLARSLREAFRQGKAK